ncbi:LacI family transcriptional regulator [Escherichia coli]|nr:LacI family transcriptional regulator [Escherichia coli]
MTTISDVAKKARVSTATVSRVLANSDSVTEKTRDRVMAAVEALNYKPNVMARNLRVSATRAILVVVPDISNLFFSEILRGIEFVASKSGYQVLLGDSDNRLEREVEYLDFLRQRQADGMILLTARMDQSLLESIAAQYPVVLGCEYFDEGSAIQTVSVDNVSAGYRAAEHLIKLGHKRIGYISGPSGIILSRDRLRGFQQALSDHGLPLEELLIEEGAFTYDSGYEVMQRYLALASRPTAVFAANDEMAIGAIKAARKAGLDVPTDLAVMGMDNIKFASIFEPAVTTIAQPMYEIGCTAMELLLKVINKEEIPQKKFVLKDELIVRESCGGAQLRIINEALA